MSRMTHMRFILTVVLALVLLGGCEESPTEPESYEPPPVEGVWSSLLGVAVIPQASESIDVKATDKAGMPVPWTAASDDESVATITETDSSITVTGVNFGETAVTVTSDSGFVKKIPVQVYNHMELDVGDLQITFVDQFDIRMNIYQDANFYGTFWHPVVPEGYHALGSFATRTTTEADGQYAVMVVKQTPGSDALRAPLGYEQIWWSGSSHNVSMYQPIPPSGYKAMGTVVHTSSYPPSLDAVVCIREDLVRPGSGGPFIWNNYLLEGSSPGVGCFQIHPGSYSSEETWAYLHTGTFVASTTDWNNPPAAHEVMNVLRVDLPLLAEAPKQSFRPNLEGYQSPPECTIPTQSRVMLVPCSIINDLDHAGETGWQVANSPFYRLERKVIYDLVFFHHNSTAGVVNEQAKWEHGIVKTEGDKFYEETSVSVEVEAGLTIKSVFTAKVTGTFSKKFGYESQTTIAEHEFDTYTTDVPIMPGKAVAMWVERNCFVLKRHNGTDLPEVARWEFLRSHIKHTDEYP